MPPNNKVCSRHDQSIGRIHEAINDIKESNAGMNVKLDMLVKSTNGVHDTVYEPNKGLVVRQTKTENQSKIQWAILLILITGLAKVAWQLILKK